MDHGVLKAWSTAERTKEEEDGDERMCLTGAVNGQRKEVSMKKWVPGSCRCVSGSTDHGNVSPVTMIFVKFKKNTTTFTYICYNFNVVKKCCSNSSFSKKVFRKRIKKHGKQMGVYVQRR